MSISVSLIRALVGYVAETGTPAEEFLALASLRPDLLSDPHARVSPEMQDRLFELAVERTKDPAFGLHMGEHATIGTFGVPGYMCMHAKNLEAALGVVFRYHRILADCPPSYVTHEGPHPMLVYNYVRTTPASNRIRTEYGLGLILRIGRILLGSDLPLVEVRFEHAAPKYLDEYHRIFGPGVRFEQPHSGLVISRGIADRPLLFADPDLFAMLEARAEGELKIALGEASYTQRVRHLILHAFAELEPTMEAIARRLSISERNLRRKLELEGTSFREVANEALGELAKRVLSEAETSVKEAAYRLGFAEPSSFHRAFKRWTGMTPSEYRAQRS